MISNRIVQKNNVTTSGATTNLWGWGRNNLNQIKVGAGTPISSPIMTDKIKDWYQISQGQNFVCGIEKNTYKLFCWGNNSYGQLGDTTTTTRSSPVAVGASQSFKKVTCGTDHALAISNNNNRLYGWGRNNFGQVGDGTTTNRSSPVMVSNSYWLDISAGHRFSLAIQRYNSYPFGNLYGWGLNNVYQLGLNNTTNYSVPTQVPTGGSTNYWLSVSAGYQHSLGTNNNNPNSIYGWGKNQYGQLCLGNTVDQTVPYLSGYGFNNFRKIVAVGNTSGLLCTSDILYMFGSNSTGQIGDGTTGYRLTPYPIYYVSDFQMQGASPNSVASFVISTTGYLWSWGYNVNNLLGDNTGNRSSPVQVGSANDWSKLPINGGGYTTEQMFALKV